MTINICNWPHKLLRDHNNCAGSFCDCYNTYTLFKGVLARSFVLTCLGLSWHVLTCLEFYSLDLHYIKLHWLHVSCRVLSCLLLSSLGLSCRDETAAITHTTNYKLIQLKINRRQININMETYTFKKMISLCNGILGWVGYYATVGGAMTLKGLKI